MSRTLHLFGTDWCAMMVPIQVIRWYRMQCYDGTDSCAIVVPIRRYCHVIDYLKKHYTLVSADESQPAVLLHQPEQIHGDYNHEGFRFLFQRELFIGLLIGKNKISTIRTSCSGGGSFRCLCVLEGASCSLLC